MLAATHPEGLGERFVPFRLPLCSLASFVFPASTQAFYDAALEHASSFAPVLNRAAASLPSAIVGASLVAADVLLPMFGGMFTLASLVPTAPTLVSLAAVFLAGRGAKRHAAFA